MEENPNVTIEVEALDEEAYKTKFKAYSMEGMPDVVSIWGQPAFLDEVLDAGVLAELNQDDYKDYGFISGSLDGFRKTLWTSKKHRRSRILLQSENVRRQRLGSIHGTE